MAYSLLPQSYGPRSSVVERSFDERMYAKTGDSRKVGASSRTTLVPAAQAAMSTNRLWLSTTRQLPLPGFASNIFAAAGKKSSAIPKIDFIKHVLLKVDLTLSAAMDIVPSAYWFSEVALRDSGSGEVVQRQYDDSIAITSQMRCAESKQRALFRSLNMEVEQIGKYGLAKRLPAGTHTFYVPILASVFENFQGVYLGDLQGELALDLTTPSTIIAANPSAGTLSAALSLIVEGQTLTDSDVARYKQLYKAHAPETGFLQVHRSEFQKTLTAGQVNRFALNSVDGVCAFQVMMVRPTGVVNDNTDFNTWRLLNLGDNNGAAIDLTTSSGISILGNGAPVPLSMIRRHQSADNYFNDFFVRKPVYVINYCASPNAAIAGVIDGGREFVGQEQDELRLTLPAAPVAEVQTFTFSGAPAALGYYSFQFRGEESAQILGNASVATIKATIEAMREVSARNLTVTASAVASAGTSFTLTIADPEGTLEGDLFTINPLDAFAANSVTARTTAAVHGIASGTYDVYIYSFLHQTAGYVDGKLRSFLKA